jgi:hypothetical protein
MKKFFEALLNAVIEEILNYDDTKLSSDQLEDQLYDKYKVELPTLDKKNIDLKIDEEIIGLHNAPEGIGFHPGHPMEYALLSVPVIGSANIFKIITNPLYNNRKVKFDGENVMYKEFTGKKITGNLPEIQKIKENAKIVFEQFESKLQSAKLEIESFHENSLKPTIKQTIEKEREKRRIKKDSLKNLNPFD